MKHRAAPGIARVSFRIAVLALAAGLAACGGGEPARRADVEIRGTDPTPGAPSTDALVRNAAPVAAADNSGVVSYDGYQAVVAGPGDTVAILAQRVGLSASELGAYNGLTPSHALRAGDELVLPPRPGGYAPGDTGGTMAVAVATGPSVMDTNAPAGSAIETEPLPGAENGSFDATVNDAAAPAAGEAWTPGLAAAAIDRSSGLNPDGTLGAPPSSVEPVPPEPAARRDLASPDLGQYQTGEVGMATPPPGAGNAIAALPPQEPAAAIPNIRLRKPVEGPVAVGFKKGDGPTANEGVDFAAAAGAPVVAAADGEVALVSQSLGGLGTIVLLRHPNELLTVYGRIDDVQVSKGDLVQAGQRIGTVSNAAAPAEPRMHFEVRRGAESLDPMLFL